MTNADSSNSLMLQSAAIFLVFIGYAAAVEVREIGTKVEELNDLQGFAVSRCDEYLKAPASSDFLTEMGKAIFANAVCERPAEFLLWSDVINSKEARERRPPSKIFEPLESQGLPKMIQVEYASEFVPKSSKHDRTRTGRPDWYLLEEFRSWPSLTDFFKPRSEATELTKYSIRAPWWVLGKARSDGETTATLYYEVSARERSSKIAGKLLVVECYTLNSEANRKQFKWLRTSIEFDFAVDAPRPDRVEKRN